MRELAIRLVGDDSNPQPRGWMRRGQSRKEIRQPDGKLRRRQDAAHHISLGDTGREEVLARRLVAERTVAVVEMKLANLCGDHRRECGIISSRIVENQSESERGL